MDGDWINAAKAFIVKSYFFVSVLFNVATETLCLPNVVVKKYEQL